VAKTTKEALLGINLANFEHYCQRQQKLNLNPDSFVVIVGVATAAAL